jgi:hypothetical protein
MSSLTRLCVPGSRHLAYRGQLLDGRVLQSQAAELPKRSNQSTAPIHPERSRIQDLSTDGERREQPNVPRLGGGNKPPEEGVGVPSGIRMSFMRRKNLRALLIPHAAPACCRSTSALTHAQPG